MKLKQLSVISGVAVGLCLIASSVMAQNSDEAEQGRRGGRGNFDPAQFQQRIMDAVKDKLAFTNDVEWTAVKPMVQKVIDARRDAMVRMSGFGRRSGNNGDNAGRGSSDQSSPEADSLQKSLDSNAPMDQIKSGLEKYRAAHKDKEAKLAEAQENLRKVLTVRQEAQAVLLGLLN
jgi:hypothetical protein